jgi:hypothetical protein
MSCHEEEHGTYRLPSAAFPAFRKTVLTAYNAHQGLMFKNATSIYEQIVAARARTRNPEPLYKLYERFAAASDWRSPRLDPTEEIREALLSYDYRKGHSDPAAWTLIKPKAAQFKPLPARALQISLPECGITFDPKARTVTWWTDRNNHTVERCRAHPVVAAFFRALAKVTWTRGTGGYVEYRNEYDEDTGFGDRGSINDAHGPIGKGESDARVRGIIAYARGARASSRARRS